MDKQYLGLIELKLQGKKAYYWMGYGAIVVSEETQAMGVAGKLCLVFDNAPRGYRRVYVKEGKKWVGPTMVMAELVEVTG